MKNWNKMLAVLLLVALVLCGCQKDTPEPYTVVDDYGTSWTINPAKGTITGGGATMKFKIRGDQQDYTLWINYPNNNRYRQDKVGDEVFDSYERFASSNFWLYMGNFFGVDVYYDPVEVSYPDGPELAEMLQPLIPEEAAPKNQLSSFVLIALGCADILWPKCFWFFRYGMGFKEVTISRKTQLIQNLAGLAAIVLGIVLFIV